MRKTITQMVLLILLGGCSSFPMSRMMAEAELTKVVGALNCELAAAARANPDLSTWNAKATLIITTVGTTRADVGATFLASNISPNLVVQGKRTRVTQSEIYLPVAAALKEQPECVASKDPSQTGLGLSDWFLANATDVGGIVTGVTYVKESEATVSPSARFGFTFVPNSGVANLSATGLGNHRVAVALAPLTKPSPTRVIIVGDERRATRSSRTIQDLQGIEPSPAPARGRRQPSRSRQQVDERTLNRLLDQQTPVRLQPGSGL